MLQSIERQNKHLNINVTDANESRKNSSILISDINQVFQEKRILSMIHFLIQYLYYLTGYARCWKRKSDKNESSIRYAVLAVRRCSTIAFS